eukprot:1017532_1
MLKMLLYFNIEFILFCESQWILSQSTLPRATSQMAIATHNHSIYMLGAYNMANGNLRQLVEYDISSDTIINHGQDILPRDVRGEGNYYTQTDNMLYMIDGDGTTLVTYDMDTNSFNTLKSVPLNVGLYGCLTSIPQLAQYLYVLGGYSNKNLNTVQVLDLANNAWLSSVPSMQTNRVTPSCVVDGSFMLYAIGGYTWDQNTNSATTIATIEIIDTRNIVGNSWSYIQPLSTSLTSASCLYIPHDNTIYVIGGSHMNAKTNEWDYLDIVHVIDIATGTTDVSPTQLPYPMCCSPAIVAGNILYAFGGVVDMSIRYNTWIQYELFTTTELPTTNVPTTTAPTTTTPTTATPTTTAPTTTAPTTTAPTTTIPTTTLPTTTQPMSNPTTQPSTTEVTSPEATTRQSNTTQPTSHPMTQPITTEIATQQTNTTVPTNLGTTAIPATTVPNSTQSTSDATNAQSTDETDTLHNGIIVDWALVIIVGICCVLFIVVIVALSFLLKYRQTVMDPEEHDDIHKLARPHPQIIANVVLHEEGYTIEGGEAKPGFQDHQPVDVIHVVHNTAYAGNRRAHNNRLQLQHWMEKDIKLPQYFALFVDNGFDSMHIVKEIQSMEEIMDIGIESKKHQKKILKAIKKWKRENVNKVENRKREGSVLDDPHSLTQDKVLDTKESTGYRSDGAHNTTCKQTQNPNIGLDEFIVQTQSN